MVLSRRVYKNLRGPCLRLTVSAKCVRDMAGDKWTTIILRGHLTRFSTQLPPLNDIRPARLSQVKWQIAGVELKHKLSVVAH